MDPTFKIIFGIIAGMLVFVAYIWYCKAIIKGTTKPNRMTWITIALISWVLLLTYKAGGADTTIWAPLGEAVAASVVAFLSIGRGVGGFEKTDIICFVGVIGSFILWQISGLSIVGLVSSLLVDTFALYPTIEKSWGKPNEEDRLAWTMTQIGNTLNILAINQLTLAILIYPIWRFLLDGVVVYALYRKKNQL